MLSTAFLHTTSGAYDLPAIMRRAWVRARNTFTARQQRNVPTTRRECLADALRLTWDEAKAARGTMLWEIEQEAAAKAAEALDARTREIRQLETARAQAVGIDNTRIYLAECAVIDARLRELRAA